MESRFLGVTFSATLKPKSSGRRLSADRGREGREGPGERDSGLGGRVRREDPMRIVRRWLHSMDQRAR